MTWTDLPPDDLAARVRDSATDVERNIANLKELRERVGGSQLFDWDTQINHLEAVRGFLASVADEVATGRRS